MGLGDFLSSVEEAKKVMPSLKPRLRKVEVQIYAIAYYLAKQNPELWEEAVKYGVAKVKEEDEKLDEAERGR